MFNHFSIHSFIIIYIFPTFLLIITLLNFWLSFCFCYRWRLGFFLFYYGLFPIINKLNNIVFPLIYQFANLCIYNFYDPVSTTVLNCISVFVIFNYLQCSIISLTLQCYLTLHQTHSLHSYGAKNFQSLNQFFPIGITSSSDFKFLLFFCIWNLTYREI